MKILHLNIFDNKGGAAIATKKLHIEFLRKGFDSKIIVLKSDSSDKSVIQVQSRFTILFHYFLLRIESIILRKYRPYVGAFSLNIFGVLSLAKVKSQKPDILYIHWINSSFVSIWALEKILNLNIPTFIFLHDMWFLTGGCHHSFECTKFTIHCHRCENLNSNIKYDISYIMFRLKNRILTKYENLRVIAPSTWMEKSANQSVFFKGKKVYRIPNFVNTDVFKKIDKDLARKSLKIDSNSNIVLFGADMASTNPYKGWDYLKRALILVKTNYNLVTFGSEYFDGEINGDTISLNNYGKITDQYTLCLLYSAADVFVIPSLAEAFGQTAIEAMACGTPVVAFNVGGLSDIIIHKNTGYLAKYKDESDLSVGIDWVLSNIESDISNNCLNFVNRNFSNKVVIDKHINLISNCEI